MKYNWRKSSYSNAEGNCVEVGHGQDAVLVRDTKNRDLGHLAVELDAWRRFVASVKDQVRLGTPSKPDNVRRWRGLLVRTGSVGEVFPTPWLRHLWRSSQAIGPRFDGLRVCSYPAQPPAGRPRGTSAPRGTRGADPAGDKLSIGRPRTS